MKVILFTQYKAGFPFIDELAENLQQKGFEVIIFDVIDMLSVVFNKDQKTIVYHFEHPFLRKLLKTPKVGLAIKKIIYTNLLKRNYIEGDHISIHFVSPFYRHFVPSFKKISKSLSAVVWGSDFYRASKSKLKKTEQVFDACDQILIGNTKMASDFTNHFGKYEEKIKPVGFGIGKLELVKEITKNSSKESVKKDLQIPTEKLILTIGYNGIRAQQHLLVLNALLNLPSTIKNKLFILVPFGYGGNKGYMGEIKLALENLKIEHRIIDTFLSDYDVAKIRICTDLVINAQISDASSASLQEHLYAGNVLLVGDWLPYKYFSDHGIKFWRFSRETLLEKLTDILNNFEEFKTQTSDNEKIVYSLSSWEARINQWVETYSSK